MSPMSWNLLKYELYIHYNNNNNNKNYTFNFCRLELDLKQQILDFIALCRTYKVMLLLPHV